MRPIYLISCLILLSACTVVGSIKSGEAQRSATEGIYATEHYLDDASITTSVKAGLLGDLKLRSRKISVTTIDGVVSMTGTVENEEERLLAITIAQSVEGVTEVRSQIQVRAPR